MAFQMKENSLFAMLLRNPWWYSILIGAVLVLISAVIGERFIVFGVFAAVPFVGIGTFRAYRQSQLPSAGKIERTDETVRAMAAREFVAMLSSAYEEEGYRVAPFKGKAADLQIEKSGRVFLVNCKRIKAANSSVEPLRALVAAGDSSEAAGLILIILGDLSSDAYDFAAANNIDIRGVHELALLLGRRLK
jgi:restriction system protein